MHVFAESKEFRVKITEVRYEYVEASSKEAAEQIAKRLVVSNADSVEVEVVDDEND